MKTFICWSGYQSKYIATALRDWLPNVIQGIKPWMSEEDLTKGAKWAGELGAELGLTNFGIVCLTAENRNNAWIHFEAGALSKQVKDSFVVPYLYGVAASEITGPLASFQMTEATQEDTYRMLSSLNQVQGESVLSAQRLQASFDKWWPELEASLTKTPEQFKQKEPVQAERSDRELLDEILSRIRELPREFRNNEKDAGKRFVISPRFSRELIRSAETIYTNYRKMINTTSTPSDGLVTKLEYFYTFAELFSPALLNRFEMYISLIAATGNDEQKQIAIRVLDKLAQGNSSPGDSYNDIEAIFEGVR